MLASVVMPLVQVTAQRQREVELRRALREMRDAIDRFKDAVDSGAIPQTELKPENEGYPPDLDTLVEGVSAAGDATGRKAPLRPPAYSNRPDDEQRGLGTPLVSGQA